MSCFNYSWVYIWEFHQEPMENELYSSDVMALGLFYQTQIMTGLLSFLMLTLIKVSKWAETKQTWVCKMGLEWHNIICLEAQSTDVTKFCALWYFLTNMIKPLHIFHSSYLLFYLICNKTVKKVLCVFCVRWNKFIMREIKKTTEGLKARKW